MQRKWTRATLVSRVACVFATSGIDRRVSTYLDSRSSIDFAESIEPGRWKNLRVSFRIFYSVSRGWSGSSVSPSPRTHLLVRRRSLLPCFVHPRPSRDWKAGGTGERWGEAECREEGMLNEDCRPGVGGGWDRGGGCRWVGSGGEGKQAGPRRVKQGARM